MSRISETKIVFLIFVFNWGFLDPEILIEGSTWLEILNQINFKKNANQSKNSLPYIGISRINTAYFCSNICQFA